MLRCAGGHLKTIIVIALNAGMRKGEILNLKWKNIDLMRRYIKVERSKSGKTRIVPVNSLLHETLKALWKRRTNDDYLFWNERTQKPIQDVKRSFKTTCEKAGIDDLRFHDLRHTFATRLVMRGVDIVTVSELLGHSTIKMTIRYSHPSPDHKRNAVEILARPEGKKQAEILTELLTERRVNVAN